MRSLIAVLVLAQLCGCVSYNASKAVAITGAVALAGSVIAASIDNNSGGETDGHAITNTEAAAIVLIPIGLLFTITGLAGMGVHGKPKPP